jgi:hypothetical protein
MKNKILKKTKYKVALYVHEEYYCYSSYNSVVKLSQLLSETIYLHTANIEDGLKLYLVGESE